MPASPHRVCWEGALSACELASHVRKCGTVCLAPDRRSQSCHSAYAAFRLPGAASWPVPLSCLFAGMSCTSVGSRGRPDAALFARKPESHGRKRRAMLPVPSAAAPLCASFPRPGHPRAASRPELPSRPVLQGRTARPGARMDGQTLHCSPASRNHTAASAEPIRPALTAALPPRVPRIQALRRTTAWRGHSSVPFRRARSRMVLNGVSGSASSLGQGCPV